jgi:hypothetical protein
VAGRDGVVTALPAVRTTGVRGAGLVLGVDRRGRPVVLRLFSSRPVRLAVVGGDWLAQVLCLRAFALGGRIMVRTGTPGRWQALRDALAVAPGGLDLMAESTPPDLRAGPASPLLLLDDIAGHQPIPELAAWGTQVSLVRHATAQNVGVLQDADAVLTQRLGADEADIITPVLRLQTHTALRLQALFKDMVAVIGGGIDTHLSLSPTPTEVSLFGSPDR